MLHSLFGQRCVSHIREVDLGYIEPSHVLVIMEA